MTSINNIDRKNADRLIAVIQELQKNRKAWEEGAYKTSNDQLYAILAQCHVVLEQLRGSQKLRKAFTKSLERLGFQLRTNTSLELKVMRSVFDKENNRIYAYVRVLQIAKSDLPKDQEFAEWIGDNGGIEEIRRTPKEGPTAAEKARMQRELAEAQLSSSTPIADAFDPHDSLQPNADGDYEFSVALVRVGADGKAALVFGSNKDVLVKAMLTEAGKQIEATQEQEAQVEGERSKREQRDDFIGSLGAPEASASMAA